LNKQNDPFEEEKKRESFFFFLLVTSITRKLAYSFRNEKKDFPSLARCVVTLARGTGLKPFKLAKKEKEENLLLCDNKKLVHVTPLILDDVILLNTISIKRGRRKQSGFLLLLLRSISIRISKRAHQSGGGAAPRISPAPSDR